jgi:hypothetical protein
MEKHKVNLDRSKISAEEIKAKQNFDQIIKNYHVTPKSFLKKGWFWGAVGVASVAALTVFTFTSINSSEDEKKTHKTVATTDNSQLPPDTPCIKPPVENKSQQFQTFRIDPTDDSHIETKAGSVIDIPANSFKNKDGSLIENTIEIKIREFYDKGDVFLSGIPMAYDSSGTKYSLETAGMIEIRGFNNGDEILNLENTMKVVLATNNEEDNFNLYYLDEGKKNWEFIKPLKKNEFSEELKEGDYYTDRNEDLAIKIEETKSQIKIIESKKPLKPRKLDDSKFSFDIDANKSQFPELASFKNIIFEVGDENKGFTEKVYEETWEDLKLVKLNNKYQVQLTKGSHIEKYIVYPALVGSEYSKAKSEFDKKFAAYSNKKGKKEKELKNYEKEYQQNLKKWEKANAYSKKLEYNHNAKNNKNPQVSYSNISKKQNDVSRVFEAKNFGVFNCDRKTKYPSAEKIMALFERMDGTKIQNLHNVNLISNKRNSLYRYDKGDLAGFGYNPKHENKIWLVDEKGDIYACGNDEFNKINKKEGMHVFKMKKLPHFETVEEFNLLTMEVES